MKKQQELWKQLLRQGAVLALVCALSLSLLPAAAWANNDIAVTINGQAVVFDNQQPAIVDGRTLVPVRGVFEMLGFTPKWDGTARTATLTRSDYTLVITIGSDVFTANGQAHTLDVYAQIMNGSTMLPLRAVLESVGYQLSWDSRTRTVEITTSGTPGAPAAAGTAAGLIANSQFRADLDGLADLMGGDFDLGDLDGFGLGGLGLDNLGLDDLGFDGFEDLDDLSITLQFDANGRFALTIGIGLSGAQPLSFAINGGYTVAGNQVTLAVTPQDVEGFMATLIDDLLDFFIAIMLEEQLGGLAVDPALLEGMSVMAGAFARTMLEEMLADIGEELAGELTDLSLTINADGTRLYDPLSGAAFVRV